VTKKVVGVFVRFVRRFNSETSEQHGVSVTRLNSFGGKAAGRRGAADVEDDFVFT
jgi:hypothetical protein